MEKRQNYATGSHFEETLGYSRAVRVGQQVFVSGTVGLDYETRTIPADPVTQFRNAVATIERSLAMADARLADVVTLVTYVTDADVMAAITPELKRVFGEIRPTNTALVVAFPFPDIKLELQVTAVIGCGD